MLCPGALAGESKAWAHRALAEGALGLGLLLRASRLLMTLVPLLHVETGGCQGPLACGIEPGCKKPNSVLLAALAHPPRLGRSAPKDQSQPPARPAVGLL